ncbi:catalase [Brochothrix thermosphacta]|uniref:catalase n=1 Tax=Brochothrix thermosphacta TaxID=2756 RepID=UPI000D7A3A78|nr:catalase [Brochothrix thermosphacta]SPN75785.1 vegetative catalase 1 [Brochothrix thermosphacta]
MTNQHNAKLTTNTGAPVGDNQNTMTAGVNGPVLLQDVHFIEKMAHFDRERVPERVVHAKGAGAHGVFKVTNDLTKYTRADFLSEVGKETEMLARFSTVAGELGSADTLRDPRGFSLRFYSEEGNYDLVGNNTPVFFIRDPLKFPDFIHTQKRNPQTHLKSTTAVWDFWSLSPESLHQVTILMSDRGIPASFRHMHGYGSHTYRWTNAEGESFWVKYHFRTDQGVQNLTAEAAERLAGQNPDYHTEDLFYAIEDGEFPSWTLSVQIMPLEDAAKYRFNSFDVTQVWSQKDYPLIEVGTMTLNRNPENYFATIEQAAFSPANIVPGIDFSPDKMLHGRVFAYPDTQRHRIGPNYNLLKVNQPKNPINNYQRDGSMRSDNNGGSDVYYEPNSFGGPKESPVDKYATLKIEGIAGNHAYQEDDFYTQPGDLYRLLSEDEKERLVDNIVGGLSTVRLEEIKIRQTKQFYKADKDYGERVAKALNISIDQIK